MRVKILECYGGTCLVRHPGGGSVHLGFPHGGSFIPEIAEFAQIIVGGGDVFLESAGRLKLKALERGTLAIAGAGEKITTLDQESKSPARIQLAEGQEVTIEPICGARFIIATPDAWQLSGDFNRLGVQPIHKGTVLESSSHRMLVNKRYEFDAVHPLTQATAIGMPEIIECEVLPGSDRRGVRLKSEIAGLPGLKTSVPCVPGTIQLTPDGTLIIIGPDGPTIGGYHQVGVVTRTSLHCVGSWKVGQKVQIVPITIEQDRELARWQKNHLDLFRLTID